VSTFWIWKIQRLWEAKGQPYLLQIARGTQGARRSHRKHPGVDRQTSVGVDVTKQTAAKTALQNAADELAGRILLKLTK